MGGEPLPIAVSELLAYCDLFYIESLVDRQRLVRHMQTMDRTYREVAAKQAASEADKNKPS